MGTTALDDTRPRSLFEIRDLRSWFESPAGMVRAVDGISLRVNEGQRVGIVGESGSGKTQTFFGALGLTDGVPGVVSGSARFGGTDLLDGLDRYVAIRSTDPTLPVVRKSTERWNRRQRELLAPILGSDIAIMFQDPRRSLIPYWSVGRHLSAILTRRGIAGSQEQSRRIVAQLGFREPARILAAFPNQLSGGEAQRAMLAWTMAIRPKLLIADEPTTGLDAINQSRVLREIERVQRETGLALVLITHDLGVVEGMVDYLYVLFGGRVVERGSANLFGGGIGGLHPYTVELKAGQRRRAAGLPIASAGHSSVGVGRGFGCPFVHRCSLRRQLSTAVQSKCADAFPQEVEREAGHAVACWGLQS